MSSIFGFSVRSNLSFDSLRGGSGSPLEVLEEAALPSSDLRPLMEWAGGEGPDVRLAETDGHYVVDIEGIATFHVDPAGPRVRMSGPTDGPRRETRLFGLPLALCFAHRGDLPLHAAAVDVNGSALLFAGPGRHGKSTLAGAFLNAGFRPLSEDTTCYRPTPRPTVIPGSAMLRIRPDIHRRLEFTRTRVVARDPDRIYLVADEGMRGDTSPVPLGGVVFLRPGDEDMRLERVPRELSFPDLWTLSFHLPTDKDRARTFGSIAELARVVPVWNLHRRLSIDTLPRLVDHIIERCLSS